MLAATPEGLSEPSRWPIWYIVLVKETRASVMARIIMWRWPALFVLLLAIPAPARAQEAGQNFIDHLERQILCQSAPDPTPALLYLSRNKHIDAKKGQRTGGETCWTIYPPLEIDGIGFTYVCASAEDPLLTELFPLLYYREPGTSPGTGLRLITNDDENAVDDWLERAKARLGVGEETELDIGEPTYVKGKTEISCNSTSIVSSK
jgi:hypothetical protein